MRIRIQRSIKLKSLEYSCSRCGGTGRSPAQRPFSSFHTSILRGSTVSTVRDSQGYNEDSPKLVYVSVPRDYSLHPLHLKLSTLTLRPPTRLSPPPATTTNHQFPRTVNRPQPRKGMSLSNLKPLNPKPLNPET